MPPKITDSLPTLRGSYTFVLEGHVGQWRMLLEIIKDFIDEIVLEVTPRGITLESFDKMCVALLNLHLTPTMFKRFDVSLPDGPVVPLEVKLNVQELLRVIKCGNDTDLLRFAVKESDHDTLIVNIAGTTKARFALACLDYVDVNKVEPMDLDTYDHHEEIDVSQFTQIIKNVRNFGDAVTIELMNNEDSAQCIISVSGEGIRKAEFAIDLDKANNQSCRAYLSNEYLAKVGKVLSLSRNKFKMHLNNEGLPCVFQVDINDGLGEMTVYVCQREM
jgi:hypothetical protein